MRQTVLNFEHFGFEFVSDFGFSASDLRFQINHRALIFFDRPKI